jgi:hypothetical protein
VPKYNISYTKLSNSSRSSSSGPRKVEQDPCLVVDGGMEEDSTIFLQINFPTQGVQGKGYKVLFFINVEMLKML